MARSPMTRISRCTHLEWLEGQLRFPLYVVDNGRSLREDVKRLTNHSGSHNYVDIPVYLKGSDGEGNGIGRRQCTDNYKIQAGAPQGARAAGAEAEAAGPVWHIYRAVARHLHR